MNRLNKRAIREIKFRNFKYFNPVGTTVKVDGSAYRVISFPDDQKCLVEVKNFYDRRIVSFQDIE